jgi:hypothetical protein
MRLHDVSSDELAFDGSPLFQRRPIESGDPVGERGEDRLLVRIVEPADRRGAVER